MLIKVVFNIQRKGNKLNGTHNTVTHPLKKIKQPDSILVFPSFVRKKGE